MNRPLDEAGPWPVRTERLTLRPAEPRDAAPTYAVRTQPLVSHWLTRHPTDPEAWAEHFDDPEWLGKMVVVELDGRLVGDLYLAVEDAWAQAEIAERAKGVQAEIGWVLDPAYAGQGYATEAVRALVDLCFTRLGLRRLVAHCFAANEPSWRLMERVGMRREAHTVRDSLHRDGTWQDGYSYALLADEPRT